MNYERFKELVTEEFMSYMPEEFQNMELRVSSVNKVNRIMDAITLLSDEAGVNYSPIFYINDMYEHYLSTENLQEVLESTAKAMGMAFHEIPVAGSFDFDSVKDNIVFQVINTVQNQDMLKDMPHREYQDLSVIYRWVVKVDEMGAQSAVVDNALAEKIGMTEGQLFRVAVENTRKIFPPLVLSMRDWMKNQLIMDGITEDKANSMVSNMENDMWIITNDTYFNGASSMLYEDLLHELALYLKSDLYLIPSSIHEVLAIPVNVMTPNELAEIILDINMNEVDLQDRLSNQVYHYDKDSRKVSLATNTPNKKLDRVVGFVSLDEQISDASKNVGFQYEQDRKFGKEQGR